MLENVPTWLKAIAAAFIGGFATAALMAIGDISTGDPVDYKKALTAGLAGGIVAVLAYLKPSPAEVKEAAKNNLNFVLAGILVLASPFTLIGCGNQASLSKAGIVLTQGAAAYKAELASLRVAGLLTETKFTQLNTQADQIIIITSELSKFLNSLTEINQRNAAQVIAKVSEALSLVSGVLQNSTLGGVPPGSKAIQVLNFGIITLNSIAAAITAIVPAPGAVGVAAAGNPKSSVPASTVKVKLPEIPKDLQKQYFN